MTKIVIVGEVWGRDEDALKRPFVGATGRLLNRLLEDAGILPPGTSRDISPAYTNFLYYTRDRIFSTLRIHLTNTLNIHPPGNKIEALCGPKWGTLPPIRPGKYLRPEYAGELDRLNSELTEHRPNLIIGLGATSVWAILGTAQIAKYRGAIAGSRWGKFLPTYHPAGLHPGRSPEHRPIVIMDLIKAKREAEYPEIRRPERFVYIPDCLADIEWAIREMAGAWRLSIDIETVGNQITCIGFAWDRAHALVIPIFDWRNASKSYWPLETERLVWNLIRRICELPIPKLFQNGLYDIRFLWQQYGIMPVRCEDDTMLLHHALQPELQKGLGFLGSIYTDEPSWKMMRARGAGTVKREDV